jgi:hypothetical protein
MLYISIITMRCIVQERVSRLDSQQFQLAQNSVYLDGDVPDDILKQMIDMSYNLIFNSLSKKIQKEILEGN